MKLISLTLQNFKGIKGFILDADGQNSNVFGNNGTGKSTLFDAFTWLLFGKNSRDEKDFGIKTLDANGNVIPRIEHRVSAVIEHNGQKLQLTRTYKERWRKQRGAAEAVMVGNTTEYAYGPVGAATPINASEYARVINNLIDEKIFKLITDPLYFNERLSWQERRQLLMQICGDITDEDIVKSNAELEEVLQLAAGRSIDETKKGVRAAIRETKKKKDEIGPRIDECRKGLADINLAAVDDARIDVKMVPGQIEALRKKKLEESSMDQSVNDRERLAEVNAKILELKAARHDVYQKTVYDLMEKEIEASRVVAKEQDALDALQAKRTAMRADAERFTQSINDLRNDFKTVFGKAFTSTPIETVCPTCGQALPTDRIERAKSAMAEQEASFNFEKAERLKAINIEGKEKKQKLEETAASLTELEGKIEASTQRLEQLKDVLTAIKEDKATQKEPAPSEEEVRLVQEAMILKSHIEHPVENTENAQIDEQIAALKEKLGDAQIIITKADNNNALNARIGELLKSEHELSEHLIDLEHQLYLCEQFTRTKTDLVSERLAEKIPTVQFIMFRPNVTNEGIEECCETSYHGVPYKDLNTGARINVGLEIIKALISKYEVTAPIFVDNAESVTELNSVPTQLIRLVVSEEDSTLRVEKEKDND
ncbi:MAG: AAA family ATPase [Acidaminococcus intestini]|jgi:DNA repair exonuclease SbcCD ATPase subunit|nr:ATP-binding protein [Acidaminococcus intestini]